jgi:hypothetical protein
MLDDVIVPHPAAIKVRTGDEKRGGKIEAAQHG